VAALAVLARDSNGTAPISHGPTGYEAWHDHELNLWLVRVPEHAAPHFCQGAGFYAPGFVRDRRPP
jgi:hypothetical protein